MPTANDPALRLLSTIQRGAVTPRQNRKRSAAWAIPAIIIAIIAIGVLYFVVSSKPSAPQQVSSPPPVTPPAPVPPATPEPKPVEDGIATEILRFGEEGIGPGKMTDARTIAVDGEGNIYVGEYSDGRVQKFDPSGKFVSMWNLGKNSYLHDLSADRKGTVYAVYHGGIHRFNGATGEELGTLTYKGTGFDDLAVLPDGGVIASANGFAGRSGLFVDAKSEDAFIRFNASGNVSKVMKGALSTAGDEFVMQSSVAADGLGNIFALAGSSVFRFTPDGKFVNRFGGGGQKPGHLGHPDDIAVDGKGRVFVADGAGVSVFDADGGFISSFRTDGAASGIAITDRDEVLVVSRTKVVKYAVALKGDGG